MPAGHRWRGKPTRHFLSSRRRLRLTDPAVHGISRRRPWGKPTHRRRLPLVCGESQPAVRGSLGPQPAEAPSSPPAPAVEWSSQPAAAVIVKPAGYGFASRPLPYLTSQPAVAVFDQTVTKVFLSIVLCVFSPRGLLIPLSFPKEIFGGGSRAPAEETEVGAGAAVSEAVPPWPPKLSAPPWPPVLPAPPGPPSVCSALGAPSCVCLCRS